MAYATDADLQTRVPATVPLTALQRATALDDAAALIDDQQYGLRTVRAQCMLAAHYLQIAGLIAGGEGGLATSKRAGEIAVTYAVAAMDDPLLGTTIYGRQFLQIRSTLVSYPEADSLCTDGSDYSE